MSESAISTTGCVLKPEVTLRFMDERGEETTLLFNQTVADVLHMIDRLGSLNAATKRLHMGYSNTLYMICHIEEALGVKLTQRVCPKGTKLTEEGYQLLEVYEKVKESLNTSALVVTEKEVSQSGLFGTSL